MGKEKVEIINFSISKEIGTRLLHIETEYNTNLFKTSEDEEKLKQISENLLNEINNFHKG